MGADLYLNPPSRNGEFKALRRRVGYLLASMKEIFDADDLTTVRKIAAEEILIDMGVVNVDHWEQWRAMSRHNEED